MLRKLFSFVTITIVLLLLAVSAINEPVAAQAQVNIGNLRIVNGLVGIGPVDVFLDGDRVAYVLKPTEATTYYFVPAGSHQLTVRAVGADPLSVPIADTLIDLAPDASMTAVAYQRVFANQTSQTPPTINQAGAFFLMNDDRSPIQVGRVRLAAAHLAVGTPQRISIGYRSGEALLYQIGLAKPYGTIDIDAGSQTLAVIDADSPDLALLANYGDFSFYSNTLYTLIVVPDVTPPVGTAGFVGSVSATPVMFIISAPLIPPAGQSLRLRIIHAAHDTAVLDVYIDERLVARRFNYGKYTEYLELANYGHTITLRRFGDPADAPPLGRAVFTINPENESQINWTLLLINSSANAALPAGEPGANAPVIINTPGGDVTVAILPDNISATQRDYARVRVINASDGVQSVGLYTPAYPPVELPPGTKPTPTPVPTPGLAQPITLTDPVLFGVEANDREIPVGLYAELNFVPEGGRNNLKQLLNQQIVSGLVYTYVIMGSPAGNPPIQVVTFQDYGTGVPLERQYLGIVTSSVINVRSGPTTNSSTPGFLRRDAQISILGRNADSTWIRVRYNDPATAVTIDGWISATVGIKITRLGTPVTIPALPLYTGP